MGLLFVEVFLTITAPIGARGSRPEWEAKRKACQSDDFEGDDLYQHLVFDLGLDMLEMYVKWCERSVMRLRKQQST